MHLPDRHPVHPVCVSDHRVTERGSRGSVPYPHRPVTAARGDHGATMHLPNRHCVHQFVWPAMGSPSGVPVAASHIRTV